MKNSFLIAIDGNEANVPHRVGTGVVSYELLIRLAKLASAKYPIIVYLRNSPLSDMPAPSKHFHYQIVWGPKFWLKFFLPIYLLTHQRPDVYLAPAHYLPGFVDLKYVTIIHDLAFLYFRDDFLKKDLLTLTSWTAEAVRRSRAIVAVSNCTRLDIIREYQVDPSKVKLIYNGFNTSSLKTIEKPEFLEDKANLQYIIHLSTLQKRKNIPVLLQAFAKLSKTFPNLKLIVVGKRGWYFDEIFTKVTELSLEDKVIFTGFISEANKNYLLSHAQCLVLASKYEGFGIPILEAFSFGCPVVCSDNSALPEVAGDGALYAQDNSPASFASQIQRIMLDKLLANQLKTNGKKQLEKFSFDAMSKDIFSLLCQVAES